MAVCGVMVAGVLLLRLRHLAREAHERGFLAAWQPVIARCAVELPEATPALAPRDGYLFLRLWNRAHESLQGEAKERLNALARRVRADRLAIAFLRSRNTRRTLIAIMTLGNLRAPRARPLMAALLSHGSPVLSLLAAHALVRIDPRGSLEALLQSAARRADWPASKIISMLREAEPEQVSRALGLAIELELIRTTANAGLARLLKLAPTAHAEVLRRAVCRVLAGATSPAEAIAAALAALRHPEDAALARRFASHPEWLVRLEAASALGRLGTPADEARLAELLGDTNWWVRRRAAQALVALPWQSAAALERLRSGLSDRFAADALRQAVFERPPP